MNNNRGLMQYFNNQISVYISGDVLYEIMVKVIEKSTGDDGISMQPVKQLCDSCSFPIGNIINMSLHQGIVPDVITLARVIPIYKANSIDYLTNYRPISVLSNLSKMLEKVVYIKGCTRSKHILKYCMTDNTVLDLQGVQ